MEPRIPRNNPRAPTALTWIRSPGGGAGRDIFEYEVENLALGETDGVDRITDFVIGQDSLVLKGVTLAQLNSATDGTNLYIGFDNGPGGWVADSVIVIEGVTDINQMISQGSLLV